MSALLTVVLVLHVFVAIVAIGGVTIATSVFPRFVGARDDGAEGRRHVAVELHRITVFYGRAALAVPLLGLVLALATDRIAQAWVLASLLLVLGGGLLLARRTVPLQRSLLDGTGGPSAVAGLRAAAGLTNLVWLAVLVLMVTKPGGTG